MALVGEILFSGDEAHDTEGGTVTLASADENKMRFTTKTVRGTSYTVLSQPNMDSVDTRSYPIWTAPSIDDVSEWSLEILCRIPDPSPAAGLVYFPADYVTKGSDNLSGFGATVDCPVNKWFLLTLRHSSDGSDAYIDDEHVADIASINWSGGAFDIGTFGAATNSNAEIAFIKLYDHVLDTPTSVSVPADDNSIGNILGTLWKEEEDGGDQNIITAVGDDGVDITYCGVACWGGLMARLSNDDYIKMSATISWDDYIIGTGHIGNMFSLMEIHANHNRSDLRARLVCEFDPDDEVVTGVYAEVYNDSDVRQIKTLLSSTAPPEIDYYCEVEVTADDVNFTFGGNRLTTSRAFTDFDEFLIGTNLGYHFGPNWDMQLRDIEVLHHMIERGWDARKSFFKIFKQNIIGGY